MDGAWSAAPVVGQGGAVNPKGAAFGKGGPSPGERVEPSDLIVDLLCIAAPVDEAVFLEQLGSFVQALAFCREFGLRDGLRRAVSEVVHSGHQQVFAGLEEPVVNNAGGVVWPDWDFNLAEHMTGVDFVLEQEGRRARGRFPVEHGPVDGSRSAILGQQRAVQVHGAQGRAVPNGFGQHPKRHHHAQVGIPSVEQGMKVRRLQRRRLRQRQAVFFGNLLDFTGTQGPSASSRPIRSRHHPDDFVPALEQLFEACGGKLRGSEKHDAQALRCAVSGHIHAAKVRLKLPPSKRDGRLAMEATKDRRLNRQSCTKSTPSPPAK